MCHTSSASPIGELKNCGENGISMHHDLEVWSRCLTDILGKVGGGRRMEKEQGKMNKRLRIRHLTGLAVVHSSSRKILKMLYDGIWNLEM